MIRKARREDASRIAEILVFSKRMNYRRIFRNDRVSFGEMQVYPLAKEYIEHPEKLENVWVYEDEFVKGLLCAEQGEIVKLYVEPFFTGMGIGSKLMDFAINELHCEYLWALEKNDGAIRFYKRHGFFPTGESELEEGTEEYLIKMHRLNNTSCGLS